jgi:hypothetical protein
MNGTLNNDANPACPICGMPGLGYYGDFPVDGGTVVCDHCGTVLTVSPVTSWDYEVIAVGTGPGGVMHMQQENPDPQDQDLLG